MVVSGVLRQDLARRRVTGGRPNRSRATRSVSHRPHAKQLLSAFAKLLPAAVLEFCDPALAVNPQRVGKPLFGPLARCYGARRGTYHIIYRIDENGRVVHVLEVDHCSQIYRRRQR